MKALAVVVALAIFAAVAGCGEGWSSRPSVNERIYRCTLHRVFEDGSVVAADAEDARECMRRAGVWDEFISDFS